MSGPNGRNGTKNLRGRKIFRGISHSRKRFYGRGLPMPVRGTNFVRICRSSEVLGQLEEFVDFFGPFSAHFLKYDIWTTISPEYAGLEGSNFQVWTTGIL